MAGLKEITNAVEKYRQELVEMAGTIHHNPEIGGNEFIAMEAICGFLERHGFDDVQRGVGELKTAFTAVCKVNGGGGLRIGFCAEYDALPEIGHACGHNLIGGASVAAAVALAECGTDIPFEVVLIGTPDEEISGGKVDLIKLGIFDDIDAAMMFHSGYGTSIHTESLACKTWLFGYRGRNAHAASEPEKGRNALDGVMLTFTNINYLRQYLREDTRIHGIIKEGGKASNVVPDYAVAEICIRSKDNDYLAYIEERVMDCAKAGALASGTELEVTLYGNPYDAMESNTVMEGLFSESLDEIAYVDIAKHTEKTGSIDMGNVSRVVPAIHPVISISEDVVIGHTREYAALCDTQKAYNIMLEVGKALAMTGYKIITTSGMIEQIKSEFSSRG